MERCIRLRRHRPVFIVDLAVPRDIEPEVSGMDDVFLYTVDDLAELVREGVDARQSAVAQAEAIIEMQVGSFLHWMVARENGCAGTPLGSERLSETLGLRLMLTTFCALA